MKFVKEITTMFGVILGIVKTDKFGVAMVDEWREGGINCSGLFNRHMNTIRKGKQEIFKGIWNKYLFQWPHRVIIKSPCFELYEE